MSLGPTPHPQLPSEVPLCPKETLRIGSHPLLTQGWVTEIHVSWAPTLKVPAKLVSWLWHILGPGDAGLTGEIIMFYPSLTPLSVTQMRTDKCSDGRTHSCSIYLFSLVPAGFLLPRHNFRTSQYPCYLVPTTMCYPLVKCQAALSLFNVPRPVALQPFG